MSTNNTKNVTLAAQLEIFLNQEQPQVAPLPGGEVYAPFSSMTGLLQREGIIRLRPVVAPVEFKRETYRAYTLTDKGKELAQKHIVGA